MQLFDTNITDLMQETPEGQSLNPRFTFGWNQQLAAYIDQEPGEASVQDLLTNYVTDDPKEVQALLIDFEAKPTAKTLANILGNTFSVCGYGIDGQHAVKSATRHFNQQYKHLMPGQFENATAYKWTYLNPEYLKIFKVEDPILDQHFVILAN